MRSVVKSGGCILLRVDADRQVKGSVVRDLADSFLDLYLKIYPQTEVFLRDLALSPLPGYDIEEAPEPEYGIAEGDKISDVLCEEWNASDRLIITTTLENMSVSPTLKAYLDKIAKSLRNYLSRNTESNKVPANKKLLVITCSTGIYAHGIDKKSDFLHPYLSAIFSILGTEDIRFINAEGLGLGSQEREDAIQKARADLLDLAREWK